MVEKPNVLWITLESTRADHTSLGGHARDTTPNLRELAERDRGRSFDSCIAPGIWTRSVSASILTGTYPSRHGAGMTRRAIPDEVATVPELLSAQGYRTAAISPNANFSDATGLDRGFDDFVWIEKSNLVQNVGFTTLAKFLLNFWRHGPGLTTDTRQVNTGYMMTDVAKRWLSRNGDDDPFFMYLHYGDPHHPYYPPRPMLRETAERRGVDASTAGDLALDHHADLVESIANGLSFTADQMDLLSGLYDSCIEYADRLVGTLLARLQALGLEDTIVVVTADHGELFGEHGLLGHRVSVHDAVAHVPMVVYNLDEALDYDGDLVQHMDVMRTVLDAVGTDTDQFQGINLADEKRSHAYVQRGGDRCRRNLKQFVDHNSEFDASRYLGGDLTAVRTPAFKYLKSEDGTALYRLPDEDIDVRDQHPQVVRELDETLTGWLETDGRPLSTADETDDDLQKATRRQLSDLGYIVE